MLSIEDISKTNDQNFSKVAITYYELLKEASTLTSTDYERGRLSIFQETKNFLERHNQYKHIPFQEMINHLQSHIENLPSNGDNQKKGGLNLTGVKIKHKKKRVFEEDATSSEIPPSEQGMPILQKAKQEKDCLNPGSV